MKTTTGGLFRSWTCWGDKRRRRWAPLYLMGLLLPGDRKSMQPISSRVAPEDVEQVHHFVATSCWDTTPLEEVLCHKVDAMLGGDDAFLIIDDTALPKKGTASVAVAHKSWTEDGLWAAAINDLPVRSGVRSGSAVGPRRHARCLDPR